jgi:hypothetical protein
VIRELELENFRAFNRPVSVRFRPITILIGKNNAGKSSIIKFLLMLQQSIDGASSEFLAPDGERVALGSFRDLRNSGRLRGPLRFRVLFDTTAGPSREMREWIEAIRRAESTVDSLTRERRFSFLVPPGGYGVVDTEQMTCELSAAVGYGPKRIGRQTFVASVGSAAVIELVERNLRRGHLLRFPPSSTAPEDAIKSHFADLYVAPIRNELADIRHLSAVREESQRVVLVSSPPVDDVGQRGEFAVAHLQRLVDGGGDDASFVVRHLAAVAGIRDLAFYAPTNAVLARAMATNAETGAASLLSDFGFGVSQCLPVFVQGVITPRKHLLIVEQPEAQLHPTAQIAMGSFFVELWTQRQVMSVIETHSANIILRIRRHIANGELPANAVSIAYVGVDDGAATVRNLDIDERGNLAAGLPMEFFGADIAEALKLGAGE